MKQLMSIQNSLEDSTPLHKPNASQFATLYAECGFYDDVTGLKLDHELTAQARKL